MSEHKLKKDRPPKLPDELIEEAYRTTMNLIAVTLDEWFNGELKGKDRHTGFLVFVFPFGDTKDAAGRCNFISNGADRHDIVALMKGMIARFEGQP